MLCATSCFRMMLREAAARSGIQGHGPIRCALSGRQNLCDCHTFSAAESIKCVPRIDEMRREEPPWVCNPLVIGLLGHRGTCLMHILPKALENKEQQSSLPFRLPLNTDSSVSVGNPGTLALVPRSQYFPKLESGWYYHSCAVALIGGSHIGHLVHGQFTLFLLLNNIPLCGYTTFCLIFHKLIGICFCFWFLHLATRNNAIINNKTQGEYAFLELFLSLYDVKYKVFLLIFIRLRECLPVHNFCFYF